MARLGKVSIVETVISETTGQGAAAWTISQAHAQLFNQN